MLNIKTTKFLAFMMALILFVFGSEVYAIENYQTLVNKVKQGEYVIDVDSIDFANPNLSSTNIDNLLTELKESNKEYFDIFTIEIPSLLLAGNFKKTVQRCFDAFGLLNLDVEINEKDIVEICSSFVNPKYNALTPQSKIKKSAFLKNTNFIKPPVIKNLQQQAILNPPVVDNISEFTILEIQPKKEVSEFKGKKKAGTQNDSRKIRTEGFLIEKKQTTFFQKILSHFSNLMNHIKFYFSIF